MNKIDIINIKILYEGGFYLLNFLNIFINKYCYSSSNFKYYYRFISKKPSPDLI